MGLAAPPQSELYAELYTSISNSFCAGFHFRRGLAAIGSPGRRPARHEQAIRQVLEDQAAAWNRGDVDAFMQGYANSPQTAFVGKTVEYGYDLILNRYKKAYANPAAMGKLSFANIAIRMLGARPRRGDGELSSRTHPGRRRGHRGNLLAGLREDGCRMEGHSRPQRRELTVQVHAPSAPFVVARSPEN